MLKLHDIGVSLSAISFLYGLLDERPAEANISHKTMPTFDEHRCFVESRPYKFWSLVIDDGLPVGSVYLTKQNEIGVFIKKGSQRKGYGRDAVRLLMEKHPQDRFLANINQDNAASIALFEDVGFNLLQVTYKKDCGVA